VTDLFTDSTVQSVASIVVLAVMIAAGVYLVARYRDYAAQDQETAIDALANLREMHLKGDISDQEFRTIETITRRKQRPHLDAADSESSQDEPDHQAQPDQAEQAVWRSTRTDP